MNGLESRPTSHLFLVTNQEMEAIEKSTEKCAFENTFFRGYKKN